MLPKTNRLPRPDVKAVMRYGRRRTLPHATLMYRKNPAGGPPRFACVVSTTIDKRATVRNRIRRLLRESIQKLLPEIPRGVDGVIIVRKKLMSLRETEVGIRGLVL
ncbi:MAG: ribonuclease P protein component [Patescibacteria group bacterium]